ncbi:MAG: hypothetical protein GX308_01010 [Epulopiscium sp.]|nr:hypothetical protein [Candidatus Epulonipiscium sp.]
MRINTYIKDRGPFDIIGDIHGCYKELSILLKELGYHKKNGSYMHPKGRKLISLGDLNDRGPENLKTINLIINMVENNNALYVYGNHCNKFYRYLLGRKVQITHGLEGTVKEYNELTWEEKENFKNKYINFYEKQSHYWILDEGDLIVVHGGIKQSLVGRDDPRTHKFCLYGDITGRKDEEGHPIRRDWAKEYTGRAMIVYGHTPILKPIWINNTLDIDLGCVFGGKLGALCYPEKKIITVDSTRPEDEAQLIRMKSKYQELTKSN